MTVLATVATGQRGSAAAHLAGMLARSTEESVTAAAIVPAPWPPSPFGGDAEYLAAQKRTFAEALARAEDILEGLAVESLIEESRSVSSGVAELAQRLQPSFVVVGSNTRGPIGVVSLGSVARRLLSTLDVPVCFAPNGFTAAADATVHRVTVAFGRGDRDSSLLRETAERTEPFGIPMRIVCFAVRPPARGSIEPGIEDLVVSEWADAVRGEIEPTLSAAGLEPDSVEIVVAAGRSWTDAIAEVDWEPGDLLTIGASTSPVSRLFLGAHASKIVRNSPVPVVVVGRGN
ncbi:nucleotide-binding universal stress UspA family protein [Brevibacterium sanguinis]|uniref:Nucleotide-binding universal stress UspA family protein n=2 Tax=Brevibacterium TaxID=1696 RepID=A0A366IGU6_9MICO|nr:MULTISPECIES: universal stress protein [Brevibacterium]RBP62015.1 nucleotide-binding universal stress UspA family protein [Brevibacterium sanguinis]RBP70563.1 nucleotide-binding universal stress UspA family protein [Brevibacterium celere]